MTPRTKTIAWVATTVALVVTSATAPAAYARWKFHNDAIGESIVAPAGGTRAHACVDRLRGIAGFAHFIDVTGGEDPDDYDVPPQALSGVGYRVWRAPAGATRITEDPDTSQVVYEDQGGTTHPATLVGSRTTPARTLLPDPVPAAGDPGRSDNFVFATAPIKIGLDGVKVGDLLGLAPSGPTGGIFTEVRAINCGLPVLDARVNLLPADPGNVVRPHNEADQLPVRVLGSRRLKVRHISQVFLGDAAPVSVGATRDFNGDGRVDRAYVFRQGDTDIQCLDNGVKVTGRTSDRVRFQERSPITTAGCTG